MEFENVVLKETGNSVSMEIILAEATSPKPPIREAPSSPIVDPKVIERKLDSAAQRRRSFTMEKQASLSAKISQIEQVHARKADKDNAFIKTTKDALEQKIEVAKGNKEAYLNDLKLKVKEQLDKIQVKPFFRFQSFVTLGQKRTQSYLVFTKQF
jgi:hypothetical protein